ncbi:MAG: geranylgeranyl reductase family protein [Acidobacteriaceae bacterium]
MADKPHVAMDAGGQLWDAIVVGAGPAGCAAAYDLAVAGQSVLLVDKRNFPRDKACAGGLTIKAVKALRYSIEPVVKQVVRRVQLEGGSLSSPLKSRDPICVMTVRSELDEYCVGKTIEVGARFRRIGALQRIAGSKDAVQLTTDGEIYRARFLVGADGASGQVRRLCAAGSWFSQGFALEVKTAIPRGEIDLTFDFAAVPGGYAWIFPKGDHLNVGVYAPSPATSLTRDRLLSYVTRQVKTATLDGVIGQYLGIGAGSCETEYVQPEMRHRVLLVGDAGGFVDPLTGEGIYGALLSGQAAARAILSERRGEGTAVEAFAAGLRDYRQTLRFSERAAAAFYANPERGFRAMRLPFVRRSLVKTYTHGLNIKSLSMRIALSRC